jgi:protein ImuA
MLSPRQQLVQALQQKLQQQIAARQADGGEARVTSGSPVFDRLLQGGFRRGSLVEWLGEEGSGATCLAWHAARQACQEKELIVVVDPRRRFYPPAALRQGETGSGALRNIVVAHPANRRDQEWTLTQALGCAGVAAVLCWPERLDERAFRRLQLAAERGRALGLVIRDPRALREPSWADVRLVVQGLPADDRRRFRVEVQRCRGSNVNGQVVEIELREKGLADVTNPLSVVSSVASPTPPKRSSRA